jgi:hypothetical protein
MLQLYTTVPCLGKAKYDRQKPKHKKIKTISTSLNIGFMIFPLHSYPVRIVLPFDIVAPFVLGKHPVPEVRHVAYPSQ